MFLPSGLSFLSTGITDLCHHTQLARTVSMTGSWKGLAKGLVELQRGGLFQTSVLPHYTP